MKILITLLLIILSICPLTFAEREIEGFDKFSDYRDIGDYRMWSFIAKDSLIGTFVSQVKSEIDINGEDGYVLEQSLKLDYRKISSNVMFNITNRHFVAQNGMYLGDNMNLQINDQKEQAELERDGNSISGFTTRNGEKIDQKISIGSIKFALENNYLDELELYLASRDLTFGTEIKDSIFMPQSLLATDLYAIVEDYAHVQLYNQVYDSCFRIEFTYPTMMTCFFTPDKRLVKVVIPGQDLKIYQDAVRNPLKTKTAANKSTANIKDLLKTKHPSITKMFLMAVIYLLVGAVISLFFVKKIFRQTSAYIALIVGAVVFIVIPFTQIPLQEYLFRDLYVPHVLQGGESPLAWGILPALAAGIIQELLLLLTLFFFFKYADLKEQNYVPLGAIVGLGFGVIEAVFLAYGTPESILFGMNLVERIFVIMFHITSAVFIASALRENIQRALVYVVITIILNSLLRYMPVFVQNKFITPELMGISLAFISILFLALNVILVNRKK